MSGQRLISKGLQQWAYNMSRFNQYGLLRDDIHKDSPELEEALRRIPADVLEARDFRLVRAFQLNLERKVLPKEQWTKLEEDVLYLTPHLDDVQKEKEERENWEAEH